MIKKDVNEFNGFFKEIGTGAILTCGDKYIGSNSMTVSWGGIGVIWNKNVCFVFVRNSRYTKEFIDKSDSLTLSFLPDELKDNYKLFGTKSGRDIDKFKESGLHRTFEVDYNGYHVCESKYVLKLKKLYSVKLDKDNMSDYLNDTFYADKDYHTMYICEIVSYLVDEE